MAKKTKNPEGSTAIVPYDAEFAAFAQEFSARETIGGTFISLKSGVISIGGKPVANNKLLVVLIDVIKENAFYGEAFDDEQKKPPKCFAFGRDENEMFAHEAAVKHWQNVQAVTDEAGKETKVSPCTGCPQNSYGSAENQRGKGCKNRRRFAILSAEGMTEESIKKGEVLYMNISPTNLRHFGMYTKALKESYNRPPFGVITEIGTVPDPKTNFRVTFEVKGLVPKELSGAVIARHKAERENTAFPYQPAAEETTQLTAGGKPTKGKPKVGGKAPKSTTPESAPKKRKF